MTFSRFLNIDVFGNVIGIIGMFLCLIAFFLIQKQNPNMIRYNIINMIASILLFVSLCIHPNIASICLEIFWFGGAIYGLIKACKTANKKVANETVNN